MINLKTLVWGFTFSILLAYMLISLLEFIFDNWKEKETTQAKARRLARQLREQKEKQKFLNSIKY